jgi:hypothetical protein
MFFLKFVGNQNAHVGLGTTIAITQETSGQYLTLFWWNCCYGDWKAKRRSYMQTWDESVTVLLLIVYDWGGSKSPTPTIVLPLQPPPNSISVNPSDFWINCQYLNQRAWVFELQQMELTCYCGTSTTFSHQTPVVVVCILLTGKSNILTRKEKRFDSYHQTNVVDFPHIKTAR